MTSSIASKSRKSTPFINNHSFAKFQLIYNSLKRFKDKYIGPTDRELIVAIETALKTCDYKTLVAFAKKLQIDTYNVFGFQKTHNSLLIEIVDHIFQELYSHNINWKIQSGIAGGVKITAWLIKILFLQQIKGKNDKGNGHMDVNQESSLRSFQILIYDFLLHFGVSQVAVLFYRWMRNAVMRRQILIFLEESKG